MSSPVRRKKSVICCVIKLIKWIYTQTCTLLNEKFSKSKKKGNQCYKLIVGKLIQLFPSIQYVYRHWEHSTQTCQHSGRYLEVRGPDERVFSFFSFKCFIFCPLGCFIFFFRNWKNVAYSLYFSLVDLKKTQRSMGQSPRIMQKIIALYQSNRIFLCTFWCTDSSLGPSLSKERALN